MRPCSLLSLLRLSLLLRQLQRTLLLLMVVPAPKSLLMGGQHSRSSAPLGSRTSNMSALVFLKLHVGLSKYAAW
jgi:hypothetical protein